MQSEMIHETEGQRTFAIILDSGDEAMESLRTFARTNKLSAASLTAIGAFECAELAYFDWETKQYCPIPVDVQVEVASLTGDIVLGTDGQTTVHVHTVLGLRNGTALAGHLKSGVVRPTLEIVLTESPTYLRKRLDLQSNLPLIDLDKA